MQNELLILRGKTEEQGQKEVEVKAHLKSWLKRAKQNIEQSK
jgi:hypothetical protein